MLKPSSVAIKITSAPDGATVTVTALSGSGQKKQCVTPNCSLEFLPGKYAVEAQHDGYETAQRDYRSQPTWRALISLRTKDATTSRPSADSATSRHPGLECSRSVACRQATCSLTALCGKDRPQW